MRTILLLLSLFVPFTASSQVVLGYYYGNYAGYPHSLIDFNCLTHIAHAFLIPDSTGEIKYDDWFLYPELVSTAHENGKKIVVSIGGWGNSEGFRGMTKKEKYRRKFVTNLVHFIKKHGYDGADIDWEYPSKEEQHQFETLLAELRNAFNNEGIELLSVAIPAVDWHDVFDKRIMNYLNWVGIMTYDFYGPWEKTTGHNTALYSTNNQMLSVDYSIRHYLSKGFLPEKLCAGMEFVGYRFKTQGLYKPHKGGRSVPYNIAKDLISQGWEYHWDNQAKVPWLYNPDSLQFITIDDARSIEYKSDYIADNYLAGVIIWKLGFDYNNEYNELLNIAGDRLLNRRLEVPVLINPVAEEYIYSNTVFEWSRVPGASEYLLEISDKIDFSDIIYSKQTSGNRISSIPGLSLKKYWRVKALSYYEESEWSEVRSLFYDEQIFTYYYDGGKLDLRYIPNDLFLSIKVFDMYGSPPVILEYGYPSKEYKEFNLSYNTPVFIQIVADNIMSTEVVADKLYGNSNPLVYKRVKKLFDY
jgi:chitinase